MSLLSADAMCILAPIDRLRDVFTRSHEFAAKTVKDRIVLAAYFQMGRAAVHNLFQAYDPGQYLFLFSLGQSWMAHGFKSRHVGSPYLSDSYYTVNETETNHNLRGAGCLISPA